MNKNVKVLDLTQENLSFGINSCSTILGIEYHPEDETLHVEYYDSPYDDELDIYRFVRYLPSTIRWATPSWTFYGAYETKSLDTIILGKQIDRVKVEK